MSTVQPHPEEPIPPDPNDPVLLVTSRQNWENLTTARAKLETTLAKTKVTEDWSTIMLYVLATLTLLALLYQAYTSLAH